ncbi:uncharacterized protein LOC111630936 [Centruroides sculpturatus]|uniref:uncharacterized protein LOC111630936 n=1 Tax=Centruroides sculpturatus TaxID=218467 RepID=UPI000C6EF53D|nr:uncharacterized protein LOC111630936 [Centruroides sculpturatus]
MITVLSNKGKTTILSLNKHFNHENQKKKLIQFKMALELLENRVSELERTVYGDEKPTKPTSQCMDMLLSVNTQLQSLIASREKIFAVFAKIEEIEKCLDPDYADELALTDSAKLELILSEEDKIRQTAECLQKVNDLKFVLDSQHIKGKKTL